MTDAATAAARSDLSVRMDINQVSTTDAPDSGDWPQRDMKLALGLLATDPLFRRIPEDAITDLIGEALDIGRERAVRVVDRYKTRDPLRLARNFDVRVIFDITEQARSRAFFALSSYLANPATIVIYENALRRCRENLVANDGLARSFLSKLTNICVAHELYHHLEHQNFEFVNLLHKVTILDLRVFRIEKSLSTLSEIAANSFCRQLMALPALPCVVHDSFLDTAESGEDSENDEDI